MARRSSSLTIASCTGFSGVGSLIFLSQPDLLPGKREGRGAGPAGASDERPCAAGKVDLFRPNWIAGHESLRFDHFKTARIGPAHHALFGLYLGAITIAV
jgi:hypothetical protein